MSDTHKLQRNLSAAEKIEPLPRPGKYRVVKKASGSQKTRRTKIADPVVVIIEESPKTYLRKKNASKKIINTLSKYKIKKTEKEIEKKIEKEGNGLLSSISKKISSLFKGSKRRTKKHVKIE
jgi:hypothetical protein